MIKIIIEISGNFIFNKFDCNDILGGVKQNDLVKKAKLYQIIMKKLLMKKLKKLRKKLNQYYPYSKKEKDSLELME